MATMNERDDRKREQASERPARPANIPPPSEKPPEVVFKGASPRRPNRAPRARPANIPPPSERPPHISTQGYPPTRRD